jgi:hypothetical protein
MWDAWAAYDPDSTGYYVDLDVQADDIEAARNETISHAAFGVLRHRYSDAGRAADSLTEFNETMDRLCYDFRNIDTTGDTAAAVGNRIAATILAATVDDGSREEEAYLAFDSSAYTPVNPPLEVAEPGTEVVDPNRWQPLKLDLAETQNGLPLPWSTQVYVGPHWGFVEGFALSDPDNGLPIDPGPPPYLGDPETDSDFKDAVVEVISYSATLAPDDETTVDIGPGTLGNNPLGSNDGTGHTTNPETGAAYEPNVVRQGDFARILAEFWADGPDSETPPGHWNTLANTISDDPQLQKRIGGTGNEVDQLEWDVKLYFSLNGALHDAAIAAWGSKVVYDYVRPITMIRHMGGLGQSSLPNSDGFHPDGLPLVDGLIELITPSSSAPGEHHSHLAEHLGEVAVFTWQGNPEDRESEVGGVGWIRAAEWVPYQQTTFVTPAFAAYVSGHSTFSRAAAELLTNFTGSPYFPGGLGEWTIPADSLEFEAGPGADITLQWATYFDAADQAGYSRLYGGIHVRGDDFAGRVMGAECGERAWEKAQTFF